MDQPKPRTLQDVLNDIEAQPKTQELRIHTPTIPQVRQDARRAYEILGKVAYLKEHPKFFAKLLEQVLCESPPPQLIQIIAGRGEQCNVEMPIHSSNQDTSESFLKQDVLQAYAELGGYSYLVQQPKLLEAVLLRLIKKPETTGTSAIVIDLQKLVPWMDFGNRLSYQRESLKSEVTDVVPRLSTKDLEPGAKD